MHTSPVRQRVSRRGFIAQLLTHAGRRPTSLRLVEFVFHLNRSSPPRPDEASLRLPSRGTQGRGFQSSAPRTTALTWLEPGTGTDSCSQPRTPRTGQLSWNSREGVEPSGPALTHACFFLEGCNPCPSKMPHHTDSDTTRASSCPRGHQRSRPVRAEEAGSAHQTHGGLISPGQWPLSAISGKALRFVFKKLALKKKPGTCSAAQLSSWKSTDRSPLSFLPRGRSQMKPPNSKLEVRVCPSRGTIHSVSA